MNPNENNPMSPTDMSGTGGSSSIPGAVDFTDAGMSGAEMGGLSTQDSLASAQDSLTSAGQAAVAPTGAPELGQLGADDPSASMIRPDQPLTPAAPVPGSIGSVTSVPPLPSQDDLPDTPASTTSPFNGAPAASNPAPAAPVVSSNMPAMGTASGEKEAEKPYYNPFAQPSTPPAAPNFSSAGASNNAPSSSTNVPPALRPQTEKFSEKMKAPGKKPSMVNILMLVGWAVAIVAAFLAVIFFMSWQDAEDRAKQQQIIYIDRDPVDSPVDEPTDDPTDEPADEPVAMMTCKRDNGDSLAEGLEGLASQSQEVIANYRGDNLVSVQLFNNYTFVDEAAAEAAQGYFNDLTATYNAIAAGQGVQAPSIVNELDGVSQSYSVGVNAEDLLGEFVSVYMLPSGEGGTALTDKATVREAYEVAGFSCE